MFLRGAVAILSSGSLFRLETCSPKPLQVAFIIMLSTLARRTVSRTTLRAGTLYFFTWLNWFGVGIDQGSIDRSIKVRSIEFRSLSEARRLGASEILSIIPFESMNRKRNGDVCAPIKRAAGLLR